MRRTLLLVAAACALAAAQPVLAGTFYPSNTSSLAPQSTEPVILGEVTDITSQAVMVRMPDGQVLPVHFDSRTVMSHQLETGTAVKVAYELQTDNVYRAQRITPIERGSSDWNELVAMKENGADEGDQYAANDMDNVGDNDNDADDQMNGDDHASSSNDQYSGHANDESDMSGRPYDQDQNSNGSMDNDHDRDDARQLPTTASSLTLVLMTGWLLLTAAGCMWLVRRRGI